MTREEMLKELQADVNAWPQRVKDAGVKKSDGAAYVPIPRNLAVLKTPDDPEATYEYMLEVWSGPEADEWTSGAQRVIEQAGPEYTWEWLMVDESRPYAPLFADVRERVRNALETATTQHEPTGLTEALSAARPKRGGRRRSSAELRAVERRAVDVARADLEAEGWSVVDVGDTRSYDLHCSKPDTPALHVEVKGTTGLPNSIVLTANEVEIARREHPSTALCVVHGIALTGGPGSPQASGGQALRISPWAPEPSRLVAKVFTYRLN